jgi:hypothetical protein
MLDPDREESTQNMRINLRGMGFTYKGTEKIFQHKDTQTQQPRYEKRIEDA